MTDGGRANLSGDDVRRIVTELGAIAQEDIEWSENIKPPTDDIEFASGVIYVICNSGMRYKVAAPIHERVMAAVRSGLSAATAFGHPGKVAAIDDIWNRRLALFEAYRAADDKLQFFGSLPWIGEITKYHLGRDFGAQVAKPDVHLQRLADREGITAQALCERLSTETGYKIATVDVLLWRACEHGLLDSRTGRWKGMR
jgi:hypothetical protein